MVFDQKLKRDKKKKWMLTMNDGEDIAFFKSEKEAYRNASYTKGFKVSKVKEEEE